MLDAAGLDHGAGDLAGAEERPSKGKEKAVEVAEGQGSDGEGTVQAIQMLKVRRPQLRLACAHAIDAD